MIITVVCDVLGKENNGTTIAAMNLIRSLKKKGHTVKILCPDEDKKDEEGYYVVPKINLGPLNNYVAKNGVSLAKPVKSIVRSAVEGSDAVHIMIPFSLGHAAALVAKELGIPVTSGFHAQAENFTNHIFLMNNNFANKITYKYFYKNLYRYVDAIHYPTQFIRDIFESVVGKTNGYVISNGVNKTFYKREVLKPEELKNKFVILFIGRYSKEKSHKVLMKAVSLSKYKDDIQLIFAGAGPQHETLVKYAEKLGITMPIFNFYSREDLIDVINYADLYVHPAEIEIEAIACLEAITCGLVPVIANSPRCATKAFAMGNNNLFENKNSDDLASKIEYWIENPKEKEKCSLEYMGYSKKFDHDYCMDKMEEMILETIKNYKNRNEDER